MKGTLGSQLASLSFCADVRKKGRLEREREEGIQSRGEGFGDEGRNEKVRMVEVVGDSTFSRTRALASPNILLRRDYRLERHFRVFELIGREMSVRASAVVGYSSKEAHEYRAGSYLLGIVET